MTPYEQVSQWCECGAVGYDNLNYIAKVFYEAALLQVVYIFTHSLASLWIHSI